MGDVRTQEVAGERDADRPDEPTDDLPGGEDTDGHTNYPGERVEDGAYTGMNLAKTIALA